MPSASQDKRAPSPTERIIPIEIEGHKFKKKVMPIIIQRNNDDISDAETMIVKEVSNEIKMKPHDRWEVTVVEPMQTKSKDDKKEFKKEKKKEFKKNMSKASVDLNDNPTVKEEKNKVKNTKKTNADMDDSNLLKKGLEEKKKVEHKISNVTITTQPGKSILKHPVASSTPIPEADFDSSWANHSTASAGTIVKKPASKKSKCWAWCCLPCGLCCACAPFECECCDCCYLKCTNCFENCFCSCCNRKCC